MRRIRASRFFTPRVPREVFILGWALLVQGVISLVALPVVLLR